MPWSISNRIWWECLRLAFERGLDYFIYLESDCRVAGDEWDGKIFDAFFKAGPNAVCGGTPVIWNHDLFPPASWLKIHQASVAYQTLTGLMPPSFKRVLGRVRQPCYYPNGAEPWPLAGIMRMSVASTWSVP